MVLAMAISHMTPLFSQVNGTAFFPTEISARHSEKEIIVTWKDSDSLSGEIYHIYRHSLPINSTNISEADIVGTVREGTEIFSDTPPGGKKWYYLVTAEDNEYNYPIVIPYGNATVLGVTLSEEDISRASAVRISGLSARSEDRGILITFTRDSSNRTVSLYRSTSPITNASQLRESLFLTVLDNDKHSWRDNPVPGISYYYAAVDRDLLSFADETDLLYNGNHTVEPVMMPLSEFLDNPRFALPVRKAPLPTLQLGKYYSELPELRVEFPAEQPLNQVLGKKLEAFLSHSDKEAPLQPEPQILIEEKTDTDRVLETKLRKILGEYFLKNRWDHAARALLILLDEAEDEDLLSRIHFYRGQCFYYLGEYEPAYLEFLLSRDSYYRPAGHWMERSLNQLL